MKLSRGPGGIGDELCDESWTESKIEQSAMSRCYSRKPLGYPGPKMARKERGKGVGEEKGMQFFRTGEKICPIKRDSMFTARSSYRR